MSLKTKISNDISSFRLLRWYFSLYQRDWARIVGGVLMTVFQSIAIVPIPLLLRKIVDVHIPEGDQKGILLYGGGAAGLYLAHSLFAFTGRSLTLIATKRVTENLRARLCMQLQQMGLSFYDREKVGDLHARVVIDTERIDVMGNAIIVHGVASVIMFLLAAALLIYVNIKLFLISFALLPLFFLTHKFLKPKLRQYHREFRDGMEGMSTQMNDLLQSIRLVKSFAREGHEQKRAENRFRSVTKSALAMTILGSVYRNVMVFLTNMITVVIYVSGGLLIIRGGMTIGDIIAFTGMIGFLIQPINAMMQMMTLVFSGIASLRPVHDVLSLDEPLEKDEGKKPLERLQGEIRFKDVSLVYDAGDEAALRDISVEIESGQTVALVGESGTGKTTFANMVLGFYFPTQGSVRIDGKDIRNINLRSLRERIGVVSQDNILLNTSIRENLRYGRRDATEEEMRRAAEHANALEFIQNLPEGFDARVGDRGVRLSGGQRQRLAIARAILKDPRILILDEATSALDSESEARIQQALERLEKDRTCIIIAHRLSTVVSADRILVFREGRLVESGKHDELLSKEGEYARLCRRQFQSLETVENANNSSDEESEE